MKHINKRKLSAFLDSEVSEGEKHCISEHLKFCHYCQKELKELSRVSDSLNLMEEVEVSPYFMVNLKQRIDEKESKRVIIRPLFWEWTRHIVVPVGATALFVLSLLLGSYMGTAIFHERTTQRTYLSREFDNLLSMTSLDDLPEGSVGSAYTDMLTKGGEK